MNNVLNKLIELGYTESTILGSILGTLMAYKDADCSVETIESFNPIEWSADAELIQRALFDECGKREIIIEINKNILTLWEKIETSGFDYIYKGDTSRESFLAAFCKVVGI